MAGSETAPEVRLDKAKEAEERRLIEAAQQDRGRFVEIYEKYFELVYAYAGRRIRNRDEAEDLTAEVFRKALENLSRFKWTGAPFGAWLLRISFNLIADRAKRAAREHQNEPYLAMGKLSGTASGSARAQHHELEKAERRAGLFKLVEQLRDDQRRVIIMRFTEEKSIREIAGELGRSEGAVKQLQFRALQNLRAKLANQTK